MRFLTRSNQGIFRWVVDTAARLSSVGRKPSTLVRCRLGDTKDGNQTGGAGHRHIDAPSIRRVI